MVEFGSADAAGAAGGRTSWCESPGETEDDEDVFLGSIEAGVAATDCNGRAEGMP